MEDIKPVLNSAELAELMGTTTASLAQQRYLGTGIPYFKVGRSVRYSRDAILDHMRANTFTNTSQQVSA